MSSVNKVILLGNLGQDPKVRFTQHGGKITILSLATGESWKDKNTGEKKTNTEWHNIIIMNDKLSDIAQKYLKKGSKVMVEGKLKTRKWTDSHAIERYVTEVILTKFSGELFILSFDENKKIGGEDFHSSKPNLHPFEGEDEHIEYSDYSLETIPF